MVCLGVEPVASGWKAETNPLSNRGTSRTIICFLTKFGPSKRKQENLPFEAERLHLQL